MGESDSKERGIVSCGKMSLRIRQKPSKKPRETDHPWVDLPVEDDSLGESVRYSLDEIRYA
jgi:hypothetical protein